MKKITLTKENKNLLFIIGLYAFAFCLGLVVFKDFFRNTEIFPTKQYIEEYIVDLKTNQSPDPEFKSNFMENYGIVVTNNNNRLGFQPKDLDNVDLLYYIFNDYQMDLRYKVSYYDKNNKKIDLDKCYESKINCTYSFTL